MVGVLSKRISVKERMSKEELEKFMHKHGVSEKELSEILGVTQGAVGHWCNGVRDISPTTTRLIRLFDKYPQLLKEF